MAQKKETQAQTNKRLWNELPDNLYTTAGRLSTQGNIGDSLESRSIFDSLLGGGADLFLGLGLIDSWPAQNNGLQVGGGQDGDPRIPAYGINKYSRETTRYAWRRIELCRTIYENDGQIASIVDLMADFATEGMMFVHKKKSVERFFNGWAQQINLKDRFRRAIIDVLVSGMMFWYRVYATLNNQDINTLKNFTQGMKINDGILVKDTNGKEVLIKPTIQYDDSITCLFENPEEVPAKIKEFVIAKIKEADKTGIKLTEEKPKIKAKRIPWKYISLNPLQMYPNQKGGWSYLMTKQDIEKLITQLDIEFDSSTNSIQVTLPDGIQGKITKITNKNDTGGFFAEMQLDSDRLLIINYGKFDWNKWAIPLLWKVLPTIMFKNALRAMEMKTARAGINTVTLWKIGDHNKGLLPTSEHFERLADMLKAPSSTLNVLWSSAIDAEVIQPKLDQIFDPKRWEELRKEVTAQFGITQAVMTGEGGNFSSSYISVQGLLQKLETLRSILLASWLNTDIFMIVKAMKFRNMPKLVFGNMSLRDEKAEKQLVLNLLDRGFISDETAMEYLGRDIDVERRRLLDQSKFDDDNDMVRRGPFMVPEGQAEIVSKQLKSQEKMAEESNRINEKVQIQKSKQDFEIKKQQIKQDHLVNVQMAKDGKHPAQLKAVQPVKKVKQLKGRPPGSSGPQKNKRTPKPRNMAAVDINNLIIKADEIAKQTLAETEGKRLYKELSKSGKEKVADLVAFAVAESLYEDAKEPTKEVFKEYLQTGSFEGHEQFMQAFNGRCIEFRAREGRKPTKAELYSMYTDAYNSMVQFLNTEEE